MLFVGTALAGGAVAMGSSPALAAESLSEERKDCLYDGDKYSHGAIIRVGEIYIRCADGEWKQTFPEKL